MILLSLLLPWCLAQANPVANRQVHELYGRLACCPALDVGDGVFYREEVLHRTQDNLYDRLGLITTIETNPPAVVPAAAPMTAITVTPTTPMRPIICSVLMTPC